MTALRPPRAAFRSQVARILLESGLPHIHGCIFLDDDGVKMILLRDGRRVMKLEQCDLERSQTFSFFDQARETAA